MAGAPYSRRGGGASAGARAAIGHPCCVWQRDRRAQSVRSRLLAPARALHRRRWMFASDPPSRPTVAYFCMEFGLDARFTIYSGGLGILAGDHMKSASDLLPVVGIGLLWDHG
jgi:hypothetical protein